MFLSHIQDKKEIMTLISDAKRGTPEDKLRLFLVYYLTNETIPEISELENLLEKQYNVDLAALKYLKK